MITANDIKEGVAYLTIGTITDVQELFKGVQVKFKYFVQPSTRELRQYFQQADLVDELFGADPEVAIIVPSKLEGTGLIKPVTKTGKQGDKTTETDKRLPTDQYFRVPLGRYCFIICTEVDGSFTKQAKSAIKKIEGGVYKILDLQSETKTVPQTSTTSQ